MQMLFNYRGVDDRATRVGYIIGDVFVVLFIAYMIISLFVVA